MEGGAARNRTKASILASGIAKVRGRPSIETLDAKLAYAREWMAENSTADFPLNDDEWIQAIHRTDRENRAEAARLRAEAGMMDRWKVEYQARWW
jgi:hypothetical protein